MSDLTTRIDAYLRGDVYLPVQALDVLLAEARDRIVALTAQRDQYDDLARECLDVLTGWCSPQVRADPSVTVQRLWERLALLASLDTDKRRRNG